MNNYILIIHWVTHSSWSSINGDEADKGRKEKETADNELKTVKLRAWKNGPGEDDLPLDDNSKKASLIDV